MGISNPTVEESAASAFATILADTADESLLAVGFGEETAVFNR